MVVKQGDPESRPDDSGSGFGMTGQGVGTGGRSSDAPFNSV